MPEWVCLLRAVNLGARNKVNMPQLRKALVAAGFENVRTYVQSGNVVLRAPHRGADDVAEAVRSVVRDEFDVDTPVLVRTPQQIRDILTWCPFPEDAVARPTAVQVVHLDAEPDPARVAAALAEDWSPDQLQIRGLEACVLYAATMHRSPTATRCAAQMARRQRYGQELAHPGRHCQPSRTRTVSDKGPRYP